MVNPTGQVVDMLDMMSVQHGASALYILGPNKKTWIFLIGHNLERLNAWLLHDLGTKAPINHWTTNNICCHLQVLQGFACLETTWVPHLVLPYLVCCFHVQTGEGKQIFSPNVSILLITYIVTLILTSPLGYVLTSLYRFSFLMYQGPLKVT